MKIAVRIKDWYPIYLLVPPEVEREPHDIELDIPQEEVEAFLAACEAFIAAHDKIKLHVMAYEQHVTTVTDLQSLLSK